MSHAEVSVSGEPAAGPPLSNRQPPLNEEARRIAESFRAPPISRLLLVALVRLGESLGVLVAGLLAYAYAPGFTSGFDPIYLVPLLAAAVLTALFAQAAEAYDTATFRTRSQQVGRIVAAWTLVFACFAVLGIFFDLGGRFQHSWFGAWYAFGAVGFAGERLVLGSVVRRWTREGRLDRRTVIVGGGDAAADLIRTLEASPDNDIRICGIFDDRSDDRSPAIVAGYPKLGTIRELVEFARVARIELLIVTIPLTAERRVVELLKTLWVLPVDIRLAAHTDKLRYRERAQGFLGSVPLVDLAERPLSDWDVLVKRIFDIVVTLVALIVLAPVFVATAIIVRLDSPGPVLFRQRRYGFNNEVIEVFKFRSMYHHHADPEAKRVVTKGDPRVTRVGRFIRKTSIDELPQLFNVLRGELSLVGPRPHAVHAHTANRLWDEVVDGYFARHKVKPGVTGWAQINGWRGEVDTDEKIEKRVEFDLYYIDNWSVAFDLYILVRTPFALLNSENAY
jgi:Undecaprenyl-phosphate glucose phosphotransferase